MLTVREAEQAVESQTEIDTVIEMDLQEIISNAIESNKYGDKLWKVISAKFLPPSYEIYDFSWKVLMNKGNALTIAISGYVCESD
jgi:hypothetical protein